MSAELEYFAWKMHEERLANRASTAPSDKYTDNEAPSGWRQLYWLYAPIILPAIYSQSVPPAQTRPAAEQSPLFPLLNDPILGPTVFGIILGALASQMTQRPPEYLPSEQADQAAQREFNRTCGLMALGGFIGAAFGLLKEALKNR